MSATLPPVRTGGLLARRGATLAELAEPFLRWFALVRRRSPHTVSSYGYDLALFLDFAREAQLARPADVDFRHVEFYLGWLQTARGDKPRTANRHLHALRAWWKWMVRERIARTNPPADVFMLSTQRGLPDYLTPGECRLVLDTLAKGRTTLLERRDHALIALALLTGLRCSELARLRVQDCDLIAGILRVVEGKGGKSRELPIVPRLADVLRAYLAEVRPACVVPDVSGPWMFVNMKRRAARLRPVKRAYEQRQRRARGLPPWHLAGEPLGTRAIWHLIRRVVAPIVGKPVHPHTLRHSFATWLRYNGADLQLMQEALGHASINTTTIYAHLATPARLQKLAELLV